MHLSIRFPRAPRRFCYSNPRAPSSSQLPSPRCRACAPRDSNHANIPGNGFAHLDSCLPSSVFLLYRKMTASPSPLKTTNVEDMILWRCGSSTTPEYHIFHKRAVKPSAQQVDRPRRGRCVPCCCPGRRPHWSDLREDSGRSPPLCVMRRIARELKQWARGSRNTLTLLLQLWCVKFRNERRDVDDDPRADGATRPAKEGADELPAPATRSGEYSCPSEDASEATARKTPCRTPPV